MKRISYPVTLAALALALPALALATPVPSTVEFNTRIFNDCGTSIVTIGHTGATSAVINETKNACSGFANLHNWRFSTDGINPLQFANGDIFGFECDFIITGADEAEGGLEVSPWWSPNVDGRFQVRTTDGEIAAFGGVLPGFNFTTVFGLHYTKGNSIHLSILYRPRDNALPNPAQITYSLVYLGTPYTSGPIDFDDCNLGEQPVYGCYGDLNYAQVGGHLQHFLGTGPSTGDIHGNWDNITFDTAPTPVAHSSWGRIKSIYR